MHRSLKTACLLALMAVAPIYPAARAADKAIAPTAAVEKTSAPRPQAENDPIIPDIEFNNLLLDHAIEVLSEKLPHSKFVVLRDKNAPENWPTLSIKLKGVSVSQLMQLIQTAHPGLELKEIDGPGGTITCLLVHPPEVPDAAAGEPKGKMLQAVRVYRMSAINGLSDKAKSDPVARKEAMNKALSLIGVALEQTGGDPPTLKIHEETGTLIFKGNADQESILENVMETLRPEQIQRDQVSAEFASVATERNELQKELQRVKAEYERRTDMQVQELSEKIVRLLKIVDQRDKETLDHSGQNERLKIRLEMIEEHAKKLEAESMTKSDHMEKMRAELREEGAMKEEFHRRWSAAENERNKVLLDLNALKGSKSVKDDSK